MNEFNIALTAIGGTVIVLGLFSDYFRRHWWTSDPLAALALGVVLGPLALNWVDPTRWGLSHTQIHPQIKQRQIKQRQDLHIAVDKNSLNF
ncbi:MAG: hypothetical protein VKL39_21335 [Leptolyngbyaceae bacterium]|nr:hypothetical protein [Leptolyngbyaceae bacterium]